MPAPVATPRKFEPSVLAAGDEVNFNRQLPRYSAKDGWLISYEGIGGGSPIAWQSTVNQDGVSYDIQIPPAVTASYFPGEYLLNGWASNVATGERYQFYSGDLAVTANLAAVPPDFDTQTYAQQGIAACQALLLKMLEHDVQDSSNEANEFRRKKVAEVNAQLDEFTRIRENELQKQAALDGRPSRKKIKIRLLVTNPAGGLNVFGAGNSIGNFGNNYDG